MGILVCKKMLRLMLLTIVSVACCFKLAIADCNDLTFDTCGTDQTIPFETFTDQGEDICQQICREVYPSRCKFFIYDREDELCELYSIDEQLYVDSCKRTAGTPQPPLAECKESNDPCTKFTEGYCIYEGDQLENAKNITDPETCQLLCQVYSNPDTKSCAYFDYNVDEQNCQLLSSPSRTCDLIRGPPTPTMKECSDDPTPPTTKPPPPGCPADWIDSEEGCFYFANEVGDEGMTWYDAVEYCKDIKGGYLAEVLNAETQALLVEEASVLPPTNWWLGGSDEESEGNWVWIRTNENMIYTAWKTGEPNQLENENCLFLGNKALYSWYDWVCSKTGWSGDATKPLCQKRFE